MLNKITEEELEFMESWHTPRCLIESLFSNFDNLIEFDEERFGSIRLYQFPMVSDEPLIDFETTAKYYNFNKKQSFKLRKIVADIYNFGARKYGKSLMTLKTDVPISMLHDEGFWCGFSSIDSIHLEILDKIKDAIQHHPILNLWKQRLKGAPKYKFVAKNGWQLDGINMNLKSKDPGSYFFGKHVHKLWGEEFSFETEEVYKKRKEAYSEQGAVLRLSGMTNFTKHTPAGRAFYRLSNKKKILNLPQYVSPEWDEEELQDRLEEYGGKDAPNFRIFVEGDIIEDGVSEFDIERIQQCYNKKSKIKRVEIKKEYYERFRDLIIVERPKNADRIFICADIGESAGSDIVILSEVDDNYNYLYDIVLYNLAHDEQVEIFKYLINKLEANVIGIDCGDGTGRAIYRELEKIYPKENLVWYDGSKKINVDFERDENNNVKIIKGQPVYRQEKMKEWSVTRLKTLLYGTRCRIPIDHKFDSQINSVISTKSGTNTIYVCISETGDHLFEAWRVFAIAQWLKKDFNQTKPITNQDWGIGATSWKKEPQKENT